MPRWMLSLLLVCLTVTGWLTGTGWAAERPNILWITSEDNGPHLGCYGDEYAVSPHLDALAARSCRYLHCWSNAPVCAPARTTIITGMYPTSLGAEHMRSMVPLPKGVKLYPQYLREAGYYCTNNSKTDYNVESTGKVWDESSNKAHWKNRPEGTPFFAIFNHTISHESQIRNKIDPQDRIHDPAGVRVPAYHPDTPEVRKDWAQYYDRITMMDKLVGKNLAELKEAGLEEDTIVFYYGDHGSGMPRSKRMPYNSGLHVPLIVHIPEKWKHLATADCVQGGTSDRLVSFVDLAPTLLSLIGADIPAHMQGHAFLGPKATEPQPYIYGFRGRMDERPDMMRSITDGRYVYIRNYMPYRPYGQYVDYMFQTPTTRVWYDMFQRGELNEAQSHFWKEKPFEELYDLQSDRDEVVNLANTPGAKSRLETLSKAVDSHLMRTRDLGVLVEGQLHDLPGDGALPARVKWSDKDWSDLLAVMRTACDVSQHPEPPAEQFSADWSPAKRYWTLAAYLTRKAPLPSRLKSQALADPSVAVRVAAAEVVGRFGSPADIETVLPVLLECANAEKHGVYNAVAALNAIDYLGEKADPIRDQVARLPLKDPNAPDRTASYCGRLIEKITSDLK